MPGLAGFFRTSAAGGASEGVLHKMLAAMSRRADGRDDAYTDGRLGLAVGRSSIGVFSCEPQPVFSGERKSFAVFDGELCGLPGGIGAPEFALREFERLGDSVGTALDGAYCLAAGDLQGGRLVLCTDAFGLKPLYYSILPDGVVFAGEVKALLATGWVSRRRDDRAFCDFFSFGHALGERTLFDGVRLVPPGGRLVCDLRDGSCRVDAYRDPVALFSPGGHYSPAVTDAAVVDAFVAATGRRLENIGQVGISLSGGLDSRAVLAAMGPAARGVHSYTLGVKGCRDQGLSARMAEIAGTRHAFLELGGEYLSGFEEVASTLVRLSDGHYHPQEATEKLALDYFAGSPFRIVLRGHGGELAKASLAHPVMVTPEVLSCRSPGAVLDFLFRRANQVTRGIDPREIFASPFLDVVVDGARRSLDEAVGAAAESLAPADVCLYYYLTQWIRRQVVASLEIFRTQVEVRLPFVDETYLSLLLKIPLERRFSGEFQVKVVARCMKELLKVPNSNTGAPLDAGPLRLFLADKAGSLFKRLRLPGSRHYTEFVKWQREQFRGDLERIVFDNRTLSRGLYRPDGLRAAFAAHISGSRNYGRLLATIVGLELWYRNFVDDQPSSPEKRHL